MPRYPPEPDQPNTQKGHARSSDNRNYKNEGPAAAYKKWLANGGRDPNPNYNDAFPTTRSASRFTNNDSPVESHSASPASNSRERKSKTQASATSPGEPLDAAGMCAGLSQETLTFLIKESAPVDVKSEETRIHLKYPYIAGDKIAAKLVDTSPSQPGKIHGMGDEATTVLEALQNLLYDCVKESKPSIKQKPKEERS